MPTPTSTPGQKLRQLADREQRVFATYPLVARYFPAAAVEDARQRLSRTVERGDGPGLVIGAPGTGKSLLLQVLATQYHARFDVVLLACARLCTRRALLQAVLFELGLPYKVRDEGDLRLSLLDHLLSEHCPTGLLLLVDEAQALPAALLDELRILTNLVRGGVPRVRLILAGSSALEEMFAHPELESFSQRLAARCYLAPLNRDETWQYVRGQVAACGGSPDEVFAADAASAIFDATDGVPRLINQLCDHALHFALAKGAVQIDRQVVQEAWSDLQRLPTPWETPRTVPAEVADQVIEFGTLGEPAPPVVRSIEHLAVDCEDTELDCEDVPISARSEASSVVISATSTVSAADPFAEEFDEEELVFDSFAAWDDIFRSDLQRVENRRDPGFSTLVQAAIAASPVAASRIVVSGDSEIAQGEIESARERPRLRLADVPDTLGGDQPSMVAEQAASDALRAQPLEELRASFSAKASSEHSLADDSPLIVIEEDTAPSSPQSPVRREDYRNLFSRLRSG